MTKQKPAPPKQLPPPTSDDDRIIEKKFNSVYPDPRPKLSFLGHLSVLAIFNT